MLISKRQTIVSILLTPNSKSLGDFLQWLHADVKQQEGHVLLHATGHMPGCYTEAPQSLTVSFLKTMSKQSLQVPIQPATTEEYYGKPLGFPEGPSLYSLSSSRLKSFTKVMKDKAEARLKG